MLAVGIKDLKARLSEYVRAAKAGETILVTDRGEVVARLAPADDLGLAKAGASTEARLAVAERAGWLVRARLEKKGWRWRPTGLGLPSGTAERLLEALREERAP